MHVQLVSAFEPLIHDLRVTEAPVPELHDTPWAEPSRASLMVFASDGTGRGVAITADDDPVDQVVELADQLQEWAIETLWQAGRPAVWPECPDHRDSHPLHAVKQGGRAVWMCPSSDAEVADVGALRRSE